MTKEDIEFQHALGSIVESFVKVGDLHWENLYSLALSKHTNHDYEGATLMYERAAKSIEGDSNVRDDPTWQERVRKIHQTASRARVGQPLAVDTSDNLVI